MSDPQHLVAVPTELPWFRLHGHRQYGSGHRRQAETVLVQAADAAAMQEIVRAYDGRVEGWALCVVHECAACGMRAPWGDAWHWYGSIERLEAGDAVVKVCSTPCRQAAKQRGLIPMNTPEPAADETY